MPSRRPATTHTIRDTAACDCTCHSCIAISGRKCITVNVCLSLIIDVVVVAVVVVVVVVVVWPQNTGKVVVMWFGLSLET